MHVHSFAASGFVGKARNWRLYGLLAGGAVSLALAASPASAKTIQLIATGVTVGATDTVYHYELELTPNNGLTSNSVWQSGTVILDFPGFVGVSLADNASGEVTSSTDWAASTVLTGAGTFPNSDFNVTATGKTSILGSVHGDVISALDNASAMNIVVAYTGAAGVSFAHSSEFNLIGLDIEAASGLTSSTVLETIGRDTTAAAIGQTESFPAPVAVPTTVPLPAALPAGMSTLAGLALMYLMRRRR